MNTAVPVMYRLRITAENQSLIPTCHPTEAEAHAWLARRAQRHHYTGGTDADEGGDPGTFT